MKVRWSPEAADDLEHLVGRIEKGSPAAARNVGTTIFRGIASLRQSPRRGRIGGVDGTRELVFAPLPYIAVYRLTGNTIRNRENLSRSPRLAEVSLSVATRSLTLKPDATSADGSSMIVAPALFRPRMIAKALLFIGLVPLIAWSQTTRPGLNAGNAVTRASLPNTTDITPSRGVGPFDTKQAQEWHSAADLLCSQSRFGEAEKLYLKLLEEREHSLGLNSPELLTDLNDLGRVAFAQNKYQQALTYYERALQVAETSKGRQDITVVPQLARLAGVHTQMEKYAAAEPYLRRAIANIERAKGPDAAELVPHLIAVGDLLIRQKQLAPADSEFQRAIKIVEKTEGPTSPLMLPALDGSATCAAQLKRQADAEAAIRRALSIRESNYGPSSNEVAGTLDQLGRFYYDQKKYPEAAYCYERSLYIRSKLQGEVSHEAQISLTQVAQVYGAQGRHTEAEPIYRLMLTARETDTVSSLNSLATTLAARERNTEAESLYKISIAILDKKGFVTARKPVINPNDPPPPQLAETLDQYTALLKKLRKKADAAKMEARARILHGAPPPPEPVSVVPGVARKKTK